MTFGTGYSDYTEADRNYAAVKAAGRTVGEIVDEIIETVADASHDGHAGGESYDDFRARIVAELESRSTK